MKTTLEFLSEISDPNILQKCVEFINTHEENWTLMPASVKYHHCFPGGLDYHMREVFEEALRIYDNIPEEIRSKLDYSRDEVILAVFVHDLDKVNHRYKLDERPPTYPQKKKAENMLLEIEDHDTVSSLSSKIDMMESEGEIDPQRIRYFTYQDEKLPFDDSAIVVKICWDHGIPITDQVVSSVCVAHGGWSPIIQCENAQMTSLGTIVHCADMISTWVRKGLDNRE